MNYNIILHNHSLPRSDYGWSPLILAAGGNTNPEVISALVMAGADVNEKNNNGLTPLMLAARINPNLEVITTLLNHGTAPKVKDDSGKMAIDYARENENLKNAEALRRLEEASK